MAKAGRIEEYARRNSRQSGTPQGALFSYASTIVTVEAMNRGAKSRVQRARARLKTMLFDCCHFELDRHGKVLNYYDHAFVLDDDVLGEP